MHNPIMYYVAIVFTVMMIISFVLWRASIADDMAMINHSLGKAPDRSKFMFVIYAIAACLAWLIVIFFDWR